MGAVIGGATFGDNISPVSDTTIASASTQGADIGGVVRSRLKYAIPAAGLAIVVYASLGGVESTVTSAPAKDGIAVESGNALHAGSCGPGNDKDRSKTPSAAGSRQSGG